MSPDKDVANDSVKVVSVIQLVDNCNMDACSCLLGVTIKYVLNSQTAVCICIQDVCFF